MITRLLPTVAILAGSVGLTLMPAYWFWRQRRYRRICRRRLGLIE